MSKFIKISLFVFTASLFVAVTPLYASNAVFKGHTCQDVLKAVEVQCTHTCHRAIIDVPIEKTNDQLLRCEKECQSNTMQKTWIDKYCETTE
jgi:hypothetical protein